jgi:hypothetical protein
MKTMTIFDALTAAQIDYRTYGNNLDGTMPLMKQIRSRQISKFRAALLARIEAGDRARAIVRDIAEAYKASATPEEFGSRANAVLCSYYNWEHELP